MGVRPSDLAGSWYPATEAECLEVFEQFEKSSILPNGTDWVGGIVPHAGWAFSGQVAYNVIKHLMGKNSPDTIIVFGRHLHPGSGTYIMNEGSWDTPLGEIEIAGDLAKRIISEFRFNVETGPRYATDNTIEVQLPIIKYLFPDVKLLPIGVPPARSSIKIGERISEIAIELGQKVKVIGSTDLTHYGPNYANTVMGTGKAALDWVKNHNDRKMVDLMLKMEPEVVIEESMRNMNACCGGAVAAAIASVKKLGAGESREVTYMTSHDVMPGSSFVGYVGVVFR
jgi:MEMO1 family protein